MKSDLKKLQGTWYIVSVEIDGQRMPAAASTGSTIAIDGTKFTTAAMGAAYDGSMEVDSRAKPKTFDLMFASGPEKGNRSLGIYELGKDTWKICVTLRGTVRPQKFATTPNSGLALETLKRTAPAKKGGTGRKGGKGRKGRKGGKAGEPVTELKGDWTMVSCVRDGMPIDASLMASARRVDTGTEVTVSFGPQIMMAARYTVDRTATPNTIDFIHTGGATAGQTQRGIFELDGKTLKLCYAAPGQPRPSNYSTAAGDGKTMAVWTPARARR